MTVETLEQAAQAQREIEDFARRARDVRIAVEALEGAYCGLADCPDGVGEAMHQLHRAAVFVATDALNWAWISNTDFDPSTPRSTQ
jgi:hypothetical protein